MNLLVTHVWALPLLITTFFILGFAIGFHTTLLRYKHLQYMTNKYYVPKDVVHDKVKNITTVLTHHSNDAIAAYMQAQVKDDQQSSAYHQGQFEAYQKTNHYWTNITK